MKPHLFVWTFLAATTLSQALTTQAQSAHETTPSVIQRAQKLRDAGQFVASQKLLEERLRQLPQSSERKSVQNALAQTHLSWADQLAKKRDFTGAIAHYKKAYATDSTLRLQSALLELYGIGKACEAQNRLKEALRYYRLMLPLFRKNHDPLNEGVALLQIGDKSLALKRFEESLSDYQRALLLFRETQKPELEVQTLSNIGSNYWQRALYPQALDYYSQALAQARHFGVRRLEGAILQNLGAAYQKMGDAPKGIKAFEESLPLLRESKKPNIEAQALYNLGKLYLTVYQPQKAASSFSAAVAIFHSTHQTENEIQALGDIGIIYLNLGRFAEALQAFTDEQLILDNYKVPEAQVANWSNLGLVYLNLNQPAKALEYFKLALPLLRKMDDSKRATVTLINISGAYDLMRQPQQALEVLEEALQTNPKSERLTETTILNNIGGQYNTLGNPDKALEYLFRAQSILHELGAIDEEATTLGNIGLAYAKKNNVAESERYYNQALPLARQSQDKVGEAIILNNLMIAYTIEQKPGLAILCGKQTVNILQTIRRDIQGLDKRVQRSFLARNRGAYARLAALFVRQNRLEEAEQVLRFIRQEDAFEFVQRDPGLAQGLATLLEPLTFTASEKAQLPTEIAATVTVGEGAEESRLWQEALKRREEAGDGRASLISTFNMANAFYVIVTTARGRKAFVVPITGPEFDMTCLRLQHELSHPTEDPRPDAQKLQQIVFCNGELESALQAENIDVALWFTSGALRYIPIDALYDGQQYLVEKPRANVTVTLTSRQLFEQRANGKAVAAGVSQPHTVKSALPNQGPLTFNALPDVVREVRSVVKDAPHEGNGPFDGKILLNGDFTAQALRESLATSPAIVHIATHFALSPQGDANSFFLLGDSSTLPVSQWKNILNLKGVGLLTLSACETGVGSRYGTGAEVSSIGEISQWLGAQSVLVSLWSVADSSTSTLMSEFYNQWHSAPEQGKVHALRAAQRALLGGQKEPSTSASAESPDRGRPLPLLSNGAAGPIPFEKDPKHPFAHPFYWSPFTMVGNWK